MYTMRCNCKTNKYLSPFGDSTMILHFSPLNPHPDNNVLLLLDETNFSKIYMSSGQVYEPHLSYSLISLATPLFALHTFFFSGKNPPLSMLSSLLEEALFSSPSDFTSSQLIYYLLINNAWLRR